MNFRKFKYLFGIVYYYVDTKNYLADHLIYKRGVKPRFKGEWYKPESEYRVVTCRVKKKHEKLMDEAMAELEDKMAILGKKDYVEFCNILIDKEDITPATT